MNDDAAAEQCDRTSLDEPEQKRITGENGQSYGEWHHRAQMGGASDSPGGQPEKVIHSVRVIP